MNPKIGQLIMTQLGPMMIVDLYPGPDELLFCGVLNGSTSDKVHLFTSAQCLYSLEREPYGEIPESLGET